MSARQVLFRAMRKVLFPEIIKRGFSKPEPEVALIDDRDIEPPPKQIVFNSHRFVEGSGWQVLTVDVKSFARPTFQIVGGQVPARGIRMLDPSELVSPERVDALMLEVQGFLQPSPGAGYNPFRQPLWAHLVGSESGVRESVDHAVKLLPALITWIECGTVARNIRVSTSPHRE